MLDPAIGGAEGDDAGIRRGFQRHRGLRHPAQAGGGAGGIGRGSCGLDREQVVPQQAGRVADRRGDQGGQQPAELGQGQGGAGQRRGASRSGRCRPAAGLGGGVGQAAQRGGFEQAGGRRKATRLPPPPGASGGQRRRRRPGPGPAAAPAGRPSAARVERPCAPTVSAAATSSISPAPRSSTGVPRRSSEAARCTARRPSATLSGARGRCRPVYPRDWKLVMLTTVGPGLRMAPGECGTETAADRRVNEIFHLPGPLAPRGMGSPSKT